MHLFSANIFLRSSFHRIWVSTWSPMQLVFPRPSVRKNVRGVSRATSQLHFIPSVPVKIRCFQIITTPWSTEGIRRWADRFVLPVGWDKVKEYHSRISLVRLTLGKFLNLPNCLVLSIFFYPDGKRKFKITIHIFIVTVSWEVPV